MRTTSGACGDLRHVDGLKYHSEHIFIVQAGTPPFLLSGFAITETGEGVSYSEQGGSDIGGEGCPRSIKDQLP